MTCRPYFNDNVGISDMSFAIPKYYISTRDLAEYNGVDPDKYVKGLGIEKISIIKDETLVDLASKSLVELIKRNNLDTKLISRIYVATESSVDESRSLAEYILEKTEDELGRDAFTHIFPPIELKQACISSSAGLDNLCRFTRETGEKSILIVADEAVYDVDTPAEPTQGAGCLSMLIERDPKLLDVHFDKAGYFNLPVYDFYRPFGKLTPIVDGHYSNFIYLYCMRNAYDDYVIKNKKNVEDFDYFCFHVPYPKISQYAFASLLIHSWRHSNKMNNVIKLIGETPSTSSLRNNSLEAMQEDETYIDKYFEYNKKFRDTNIFKFIYNNAVIPSLLYNPVVGNIYTGSLYLSLASLIENTNVKEDSKIGIGAYGSGASSMVFDMYLKSKKDLGVKTQLEKRKKLDIEEYKSLRSEKYFKKFLIKS